MATSWDKIIEESNIAKAMADERWLARQRKMLTLLDAHGPIKIPKADGPSDPRWVIRPAADEPIIVDTEAGRDPLD